MMAVRLALKKTTLAEDELRWCAHVRLGAEAMLSDRIALRAGYRYSSSPVKNARLKGDMASTEVLVSGPAVHYTLPDSQNSYSLGAGFRITPSLSLDLAYVYSDTKARTFAFPYVNDYAPTSMLRMLISVQVRSSPMNS